MRGIVVMCALVACTLGKPDGFFHQQMQYSRKAESYRDNELERSEGDEAFYSKHGDLEGRTQPKVDSHSSHTEYENPKFKNQGGASGNLMYGQGSNAGYGYNNRDYLSRGTYGGLGYQDASNFDSMASSSSHNRQYASRGISATGGGYSAAGTHGGYSLVPAPAAGAQLEEMSRRLHEQMSRQLQSAIRNEYQAQSAFSTSSSSSSSSNYNNHDFRTLEDEIRQNLTRQFQEALNNQYRSQTSSIPYPFTSGGGIKQEFEELKTHVEQDLLKELRQGVQTQYGYRPAVSYRPVLEYRAPAPAPVSVPTYNTKSSNWDSSASYHQAEYQPQQYPQQQPTVTFVPLTDVTSRVEETVARKLQSALLEVDRQFNEQSSQVYTSDSGYNVDYSGKLNDLTDQLVRNLTETLEDELRRNYGRYEERDSYVYVDSRPVFRINELEEKKQQIRNELIRKLENSYRQKYNNFVQRVSYVSQQQQQHKQQQQQQSHQSYQPVVRPQPLSTGGYSSSSSASHSASASYNQNSGSYSPTDYPEDLNVVANEVQTDLTRQLQSALTEQEKQLRHMMAYSQQQDRPNYQQTLEELQDELRTNFTNKLDDSLRRHYKVETQSGSYFFATGGGSGSQNQQQMQQKLERLRDTLQSQLMQQLERGMAHQQSYYQSSGSSSSSSSASSGIKSAKLSQYPSSSYSQNYGSGLTYEEDCDTQGSDPHSYRRSVRSTADQQQQEDVEDLVQRTELHRQKNLDKLTQQQENPDVSGKLQTHRGDVGYTSESQQQEREREEVSSNQPSRPPKRTYPAKQRIHARPPFSFNKPSSTQQEEDLTQQRQEETADLTQQVQQPESIAPLRNYPSRPYTSSPVEDDTDLTQQKAQVEDLSQVQLQNNRYQGRGYSRTSNDALTQQQEQTEEDGSPLRNNPSRGFTWTSNPTYRRNNNQVSGSSQTDDLTQQQQQEDLVQRPTNSWHDEDVTPQRGTPTRNYPLSYKPVYPRPNRYNDQVTNPTLQQGQVEDLTQQQQREPVYVNYQTGFQPTSRDLIRQPGAPIGNYPTGTTGVSGSTFNNNYDAQAQEEDLTQQQEQVVDLTQQRQTQDYYLQQPVRGPSWRVTTPRPRTSYFTSQDLSSQQTTDLGLQQSRDLTQQQEFDDLTNKKPTQAKPLSVIGLDEQRAEDENNFGKLEIGSHVNRNWRHHDDKKPTVGLDQQQEQVEDLTQVQQKPTVSGSLWDDSQRTENQDNFGKLEIGSQSNRNVRLHSQKPVDLGQQQEQVEDLTQVQQKPTVSGSLWDDSQRRDDRNNFGSLQSGSQTSGTWRQNTRPTDLTQQQEQVEDLTQVQQRPTVSGSLRDDSQFYHNERQSHQYELDRLRNVGRSGYHIGQGAQYELETEHVGVPKTTPKINYANQGQLEDNFGRADEFYSLTTEKQRALVVADTNNDRRNYVGVKGGRGRSGSPFSGQLVEGQYQIEPTIAPTADVEQFTSPQQTEEPGFWKKVGNKLENTYHQAKAATTKLAKNIRTSVGY